MKHISRINAYAFIYNVYFYIKIAGEIFLSKVTRISNGTRNGKANEDYYMASLHVSFLSFYLFTVYTTKYKHTE